MTTAAGGRAGLLASVCALSLLIPIAVVGSPTVAEAAAAPQVRVPVLMYHHIGDPAGHGDPAEYYVSPAAFEAQMAYLAGNGFTPVSLEQVLAALQGEGALPAQPVAITFDDGDQDNYDAALPVLRKYNLFATFLIVTGWVGQPGRLTWDEIAQLQQDGMAFGAHTVTHPYLPNLSLAAADYEISDSKATLEQHLGEPVTVFAYPYGHNAPAIEQMVQRAGFGIALGTSPYRAVHSLADRFFLTRFGVYRWTGLANFKAHVPANAGPRPPAATEPWPSDEGDVWRWLHLEFEFLP